MIHLDPKTKKQILIFLLFINGLYLLNIIKSFIDGFGSLFGGVTVAMIIGLVNLYFGYLAYTGDI